MPRWNFKLTPEQRKAKKREYDRARRIAQTARRDEVRAEQLVETTTRHDPLQQVSQTLSVVGPSHGLRIAVIPDTQVKPGVPVDHLAAAGKYIADQQPDVVVCIGDWFDFPSLSTYHGSGHAEMVGRNYMADLGAGKLAMDLFMNPIARATTKRWTPQLVFTKGNHEDRVERAIDANPIQLRELMQPVDSVLEEYGWLVYPYLQPVTINGVAFNHFFPSGTMGKPLTTAAAILRKMHMSAFAGHLQGRDIAYSKRADGRNLTAIISGSFYQHDERYLSPFTNLHWRGMWVLNEVKDGTFDEMAVSISYLQRRFK